MECPRSFSIVSFTCIKKGLVGNKIFKYSQEFSWSLYSAVYSTHHLLMTVPITQEHS